MGLLDSRFYRVTLTFVSGACWIKLFYTHFATHTATSGPSMYPTLPATQSTAVIQTMSRYGRGIKVGDVIVAKHPWYARHGVGKRVIGMPGDYVILDPPNSAEANVGGLGYYGDTTGKMVQVPEGHCWLAGDNLPWSRDSRTYGPLPLGLVDGKLLGVWEWRFPWGKWHKVGNNLEPIG